MKKCRLNLSLNALLSLFPKEMTTLPRWAISQEGMTQEQLRVEALHRFYNEGKGNHNNPVPQIISPKNNGSVVISSEEEECLRAVICNGDIPKNDKWQTIAVNCLDKFCRRESDNTPFCKGTDTDSKQVLFSNALLDFEKMIRSVDLPSPLKYFLCCGTALGVIREKRFIPHDDDIDIGIFAPRSGTLEKNKDTNSQNNGNTKSDGSEEEIIDVDVDDSQDILLKLLSAITSKCDGSFQCFDMLGETDKGLELRLIHIPTGVKVDVNFYYHSVNHIDGDFVWCATHYGNSQSRRHGMYRYKHKPFEHLLQSVSGEQFLAYSSSHITPVVFMLPPISYLEEYFGKDDWKVPKQYSYEDGLERGEYKNLIIE
eukprot:Tbor_TRINITY_DN5212_c0_g1::TRINITY_DN5212_c0_g1_i1::g.16188::m.16188